MRMILSLPQFGPEGELTFAGEICQAKGCSETSRAYNGLAWWHMLVFLILLFVPLVAFLLFLYFVNIPDTRTLWRTSVLIGLMLGLLRAGLACSGWYIVERTGGPLQVPAFAMSMLALPEGILLGRQSGLAPMSFYLLLALLLTVSSTLLIAGLAFLANVARGRRP